MSDQSPVVRRLLGPAGPEVTCEECFERLDAFVELELAGADAERAVPGMRAHLRGLSGLPRGPREPRGVRERRARLSQAGR
ncbi:MAG: hypothetical protein M3P39_09410 [Actinomycetota bacterium]|nr:hypothetical protein [Actinomycetota bacterium]